MGKPNLWTKLSLLDYLASFSLILAAKPCGPPTAEVFFKRRPGITLRGVASALGLC